MALAEVAKVSIISYYLNFLSYRCAGHVAYVCVQYTCTCTYSRRSVDDMHVLVFLLIFCVFFLGVITRNFFFSSRPLFIFLVISRIYRILYVSYTVTIGTMPNNNGGHNGRGLNTLCVNRPLNELIERTFSLSQKQVACTHFQVFF